MDQPTVGKKTFILKMKIDCKDCEEKMKNLLQNFSGVCEVSIDAEQGRITISGNIDPKEVMEYVRRKVKNAKLSWEPVVAQKDLEMSRNHQLIHDNDVVQLKKLSEIKGLKTVEISRNGMKITFKEDADLGGKNAYPAATSLDQQRAFHEYCCCSIRNQAAMYMQCTICMASQGNIPLGIPVQEYYPPSAPPVSEKYYPHPPPQQDKSYPDYPFFYTENYYPNYPPQQAEKSYPDYMFDYVFGDEYQTGACSIL